MEKLYSAVTMRTPSARRIRSRSAWASGGKPRARTSASNRGTVRISAICSVIPAGITVPASSSAIRLYEPARKLPHSPTISSVLILMAPLSSGESEERAHALGAQHLLHLLVGWAPVEAAGGVENFGQQTQISRRVDERAWQPPHDPMGGVVDVRLCLERLIPGSVGALG